MGKNVIEMRKELNRKLNEISALEAKKVLKENLREIGLPSIEMFDGSFNKGSSFPEQLIGGNIFYILEIIARKSGIEFNDYREEIGEYIEWSEMWVNTSTRLFLHLGDNGEFLRLRIPPKIAAERKDNIQKMIEENKKEEIMEKIKEKLSTKEFNELNFKMMFSANEVESLINQIENILVKKGSSIEPLISLLEKEVCAFIREYKQNFKIEKPN